MVKWRFRAYQWYLISFAEDKEEDVFSGQLLTCSWQYDIAECFFWLSVFFREVTDVWLLPLDPVVICFPTAKSGWSQWEKNGFCELTFTFCPRTAELHHQKQTLMGRPPRFPQPWKIHGRSTAKLFECIFTCEYPAAYLPSGPDFDQTDLDQVPSSSRWADWCSSQELGGYVVWICSWSNLE